MSDRLIDAGTLLDRLEDPDLAVLEIGSGAVDEFRKGHVPGAAWANWKDLFWEDWSREFRPSAEISKRLGELGVGDRTDLVVYGNSVQFGSYAYWALTLRGQQNVALLDGGKDHWLEAGLPLRGGVEEHGATAPRPFAADDPSIRVGRDEILASLSDGRLCIVDVRTAEEYRGEATFATGRAIDSGGQRTGHIPGARNLFFRDFVHEDSTFRSVEEISKLLDAHGITTGDEVVVYCRLSHRSSLAWFALTELAGVTKTRLYDGSWTEWGSIVGVPIER